jgi:hypothetical protein
VSPLVADVHASARMIGFVERGEFMARVRGKAAGVASPGREG